MTQEQDRALVKSLSGFLKIYRETGEDNMVGSLDEWEQLLKVADRGLEAEQRVRDLEAGLRELEKASRRALESGKILAGKEDPPRSGMKRHWNAFVNLAEGVCKAKALLGEEE